MFNGKESFPIPPYGGNAGDGFAGRSQPVKSLTEELEEESSNTRKWALKDTISYLVSNEISGTDIDVKKTINIRHNLKWTECDEIIAKAKKLVPREVARLKAELAVSEQRRIQFETLAAPFTTLGLELQHSADRYILIGLNEEQLRLCSEALNEGVE